MIRKDYILRMVEEFARFLAAIVGLRKEGKLDDALKKIDAVYRGMIDLDPAIIKSISTDELLDFLLNEKKFNHHYLKMLAELLFEEGLVYLDLGDPVSAQNVLQKAKILINHLMDNDSTYSFDWYEKLRIIDESL